MKTRSLNLLNHQVNFYSTILFYFLFIFILYVVLLGTTSLNNIVVNEDNIFAVDDLEGNLI